MASADPAPNAPNTSAERPRVSVGSSQEGRPTSEGGEARVTTAPTTSPAMPEFDPERATGAAVVAKHEPGSTAPDEPAARPTNVASAASSPNASPEALVQAQRPRLSGPEGASLSGLPPQDNGIETGAAGSLSPVAEPPVADREPSRAATVQPVQPYRREQDASIDPSAPSVRAQVPAESGTTLVPSAARPRAAGLAGAEPDRQVMHPGLSSDRASEARRPMAPLPASGPLAASDNSVARTDKGPTAGLLQKTGNSGSRKTAPARPHVTTAAPSDGPSGTLSCASRSRVVAWSCPRGLGGQGNPGGLIFI